VRYGGTALRSGQRCYWKVRSWDQDGVISESEPARWQMGLLEASDWQAKWIGRAVGPVDERGMSPSPYLRRAFHLGQPIKRATLYVTARGLYVCEINGERLRTTGLSPDWTDYRKRVLYDAYDVTDRLERGPNVVGAILGDGWYSGYVGFKGDRALYGDRPELLLQLHVELEDGTSRIIASDEAWRAAAGPLVCSDLLMGETYDARRELGGWSQVGYDDSMWQSVVAQPNSANLVAQSAESVGVVACLGARSIEQLDGGINVVDLGQNFAGYVRLNVRGEAGTRVELRFGEILNADGTVYTANLRSARATDVYILRGDGDETWEPHFTYHGFRYVEIRGWPGELEPGAIVGCALQSEVAQAGEFECSSPLINQLWRNITWGQRSNFVSIPTDCPQRDERLGWLGDVLVFGRTACLNADAAAFLARWMQTVEDAQSAAGAFPDVAPRVVAQSDGAPGWGDTGVYLPWLLHRVYGDADIVERHYPAMAQWMQYIQDANPDFLRTNRLNRNFGDWVSYLADTPRDMLATALWAFETQLMSSMAATLGRTDDVTRWESLFERIKTRFVEAYVSEDGRVAGETQTAYVVALQYDLLPPDLRAVAAAHLVEDIQRRGWHLSTGFMGASLLLPALSEAGYDDVAYRLLNNVTCPSWGYMVSCGATTMWERWDSLTPEGRVFDPDNPTFLHPQLGPVAGMNSFNHYAFGSVGEWLYRFVAGIDVDPVLPGFRRILIRPRPGGGLSFARAVYESMHGRIVSDWRIDERGEFHLRVSIPANTTATVRLPRDNDVIAIGSGDYEFSVEGVTA
jgi:alpha-L-rhamnosidase